MVQSIREQWSKSIFGKSTIHNAEQKGGGSVDDNDKHGGVSQKLVSGQDDDLEAFGFTRSYPKSLIIYGLCLLSFGVVPLIFYWNPHLHLYSAFKKCPLRFASKILIVNDYKGKFKTYFIKSVKDVSVKNYRGCKKQDIERLGRKKLEMNLENGTRISGFGYRAFWCKKQGYAWDDKNNVFSRIVTIERYTYCSELCKFKSSGLTKDMRFLRRIVHGYNEIKVPVHSIPKLILTKIVDPMNIVYELSLAVWIPMGYYYYASVLAFLIIYGTFRTIAEIRKNQLRLQKKVLETNETVRILKSADSFEDISSVELVPGDIIELPRNKQGIITCDAVLLSGVCVVNESMLTGESTPITKSALQPWEVVYDRDKHSNHTLFCGTTIMQTKNYGAKPILAIVIRTGIQTSKGALISAILYPPALGFKFERESNRIIAIVLSIAFCGFIYTVVSKNLNGLTALAFLQAFSVFSLIIPPALPVIMMVGTSYSQMRLKRAGVYCTDTRVINEAGRIDCCCFDKTGTLTEEELDFLGVVPNVNNQLGESEKYSSALKNYPIFKGMLLCHSLSVIQGKIVGNPLDQKMYEMTGWSLGETEIEDSQETQTIRTVYSPSHSSLFPEKEEISIIQQYLFSSELQRMSVIARLSDGSLRVYTKGSPEMISSLCTPESQPENFASVLEKYTAKGCRVIALACSEFNADDTKLQIIPRESVEKDLIFLGLVVFKNQLKNSTISVINELREANVKTIMITGDNLKTAISVARECNIIYGEEIVLSVTVEKTLSEGRPNILFLEEGTVSDQRIRLSTSAMKILERGLESNKFKLALTGKTWHAIYESYPNLVQKVCEHGVVFARMAINQKRQLIIELIQLGYHVAMCGDGANDCAALKAAHVGISLSETQSGVASSFTSTTPDITCVPAVIKEGRATLVSSFGLFKYVLICCLIEFGSTMILYASNLKISDIQYMFIEVGLTLSVNFSFGNAKPSPGKLTEKLPITSLLNFIQILSFLVHTFLMIVMQLTVLLLVRRQTWYESSLNGLSSYEDFSIFCLSMFQYIMSAVLLSAGKPHRMPVYTNYVLVVCLTVLAIASVYLTLASENWITTTFSLRVPPSLDWKWKILAFALLNTVSCFVFEKIILKWIKYCYFKIIKKSLSNNKSCLPKINQVDSNKILRDIKIDHKEIRDENLSEEIEVYDNPSFVNDEINFSVNKSNKFCTTKL